MTGLHLVKETKESLSRSTTGTSAWPTSLSFINKMIFLALL